MNNSLKTIGLIGGLSWESTSSYYTIINETVRQALGGLHSAKLILSSVDFAEIDKCQNSGNWHKCADILSCHAAVLQKSGADFIIICSNTSHLVYDQIASAVSVPVHHIADTVVSAIKNQRFSKAALLATKFTIDSDIYKSRLEGAGIELVLPSEDASQKLNNIIFGELCRGIVSADSKNYIIELVHELCRCGAQCVILGCTELGLLLHKDECTVPIFDSARIHAETAAKLSL